MRILILTDQFPPLQRGGMATHAVNIATYLSTRHEVLVVTSKPSETVLRRSLKTHLKEFTVRLGGRLTSWIFPAPELPTIKGDDPFALLPVLSMHFASLDALMIDQIASSFRPDVVHSCTSGLVTAKFVARHVTITRAVGNDFSLPWCGYNLPLRSVLYRLPGKRTKDFFRRLELVIRQRCVLLSLKGSAVVVANSSWTSEKLESTGVDANRITPIVGGVDVSLFRPPTDMQCARESMNLPAEVPILLTVANLVRRKGIDTMLKVIRCLKPRYPTICYIVVGDGEDRDYLRNLVDDFEIEDHVMFTGRVSNCDLVTYYQAANIYAQPSRLTVEDSFIDVEGMGRTYFEAGACGKPVIGARVGGVPDVIEHEVNGFLVEHPEDVSALAKHVEELLRSEELRKGMGDAGLKRAREEFSWEMVGAEFQKLMEAACGRGDASPEDASGS